MLDLCGRLEPDDGPSLSPLDILELLRELYRNPDPLLESDWEFRLLRREEDEPTPPSDDDWPLPEEEEKADEQGEDEDDEEAEADMLKRKELNRKALFFSPYFRWCFTPKQMQKNQQERYLRRLPPGVIEPLQRSARS